MLRIGDFSRMAQVTIITLRHYDQVGLLKPVEVDPFTGYRYYSASQLPRLNRILILKDLGFNLEQIRPLLDENLPVEQFAGMLKMKKAEVERQVAAEQARLSEIEARLSLIQHENQLPEYDIMVKKIEPFQVLSIKDTISSYGRVGQLWNRLIIHLREHGFVGTYPTIAIWQETEYQDHDIAAEGAIPFEGRIPTNERIQLRTLPAVEMMVCTVHRGNYEYFDRAYAALFKWNEANGFRVNGPIREMYLYSEKDNYDANVTEIQLPVERV